MRFLWSERRCRCFFIIPNVINLPPRIESSPVCVFSALREMRHSGCPSDSLFCLFFHTLSDTTIFSFNRTTAAFNPFINKHIKEDLKKKKNSTTLFHTWCSLPHTWCVRIIHKCQRLTTTQRSPIMSKHHAPPCEIYWQRHKINVFHIREYLDAGLHL